MNQQDQARIQVLNSVLEYHLPIAQAAEIMGISERHTKRLLAAYRRDGPAALAHGNRGRRPHNAVPEAAAAAVVKLASNGYAGANHTHLTELLRERESIDLSRPTVRRILTKAGIGSPRRRRSQQHRFRRRRMPQEGMLVQIDGSNHPWLEDRGPKLTLLIAVDDATGTVAQAVFRTSEDTRGYLVLLEGLIRQWAIPLALYSDRHAAFKYNARQKPVPVETTHQFARVMRELGIQQIFALSPQAKGRVERMLETFQDRLVTELRLAGASTIDQAKEVLQEFLPKINARFAVPAEHPETAYRPVPAQLSLTETICIKDTRKVARDNTVKYHWRVLQLLPGAERPSYAGLGVDVLERADGELPPEMIRYQGEAVDYQEGPPPSSALWGAASACSPGPEQQEGADGVVNSHLNEAQRERLAALESSESSDNNEANDEDVATRVRGGKRKPVRHQLRRTPTETQQARWEAVRYNRPGSRGFPSGPSPGSWAWTETPPESTPWRRLRLQRNSVPRSVPKQRPWPDHQPPPTKPGDIFAFHLRGHNRWTTTYFSPAESYT